MKRLFLTGLVCILSFGLKAQTTSEETEGVVSFISSQNTYVRYKSTSGILTGDTLYMNSNHQLIPALVVKNLSSTSVVCSSIASIKLNIDDKIIAIRRIENKEQEKIKIINKDSLSEPNDISDLSGKKKSKPNPLQQKINGQIGVSSSLNFSNTTAHNSYLFNYALSLNIMNIADSRFSMESNILFRQENGEWSNVQKNIFNGLKIYDLSLKYEFNDHSYVSFGRKINPYISNIGAIDGFQVQKSFKNLFIGGFIGSRPDYMNYSFNFNLIQYGAYIGHNIQTSGWNMQNSLAIVEQTNHSITDRRFLYFQHSNSLLKNVQMFYSLEADLYKVLNGQMQNTISLTSSYFSLRYRPFKKLTLSGTYDSRKNVIYYETDKNYLSTLIESETRQGLSLQGNYSIFKNLYTGARVGYRFQKKDNIPTKNAYLFVTHSNLFNSEISTTLSVTILETNYINGNVYNLRLSRGFNAGKINIGLGYSFVNYKILNAELPLRQNIADFNISAQIIKKVFFSLNFESDFERSNKFYRLYLQLRKRF